MANIWAQGDVAAPGHATCHVWGLMMVVLQHGPQHRSGRVTPHSVRQFIFVWRAVTSWVVNGTQLDLHACREAISRCTSTPCTWFNIVGKAEVSIAHVLTVCHQYLLSQSLHSYFSSGASRCTVWLVVSGELSRF